MTRLVFSYDAVTPDRSFEVNLSIDYIVVCEEHNRVRITGSQAEIRNPGDPFERGFVYAWQKETGFFSGGVFHLVFPGNTNNKMELDRLLSDPVKPLTHKVCDLCLCQAQHVAPATDLSKTLPALTLTKADCPAPVCCRGNRSVWDLVIHLNDDHHWPRETIADWLDDLGIDLAFPVPEDLP